MKEKQDKHLPTPIIWSRGWCHLKGSIAFSDKNLDLRREVKKPFKERLRILESLPIKNYEFHNKFSLGNKIFKWCYTYQSFSIANRWLNHLK